MMLGYPEVASPARVKPYSEEIRERLTAYRDTHKISNSKLARQLNTSDTAVSKYLNGKPEGDVARFEANAADLLKNSERFKGGQIHLFETPVSKAVRATFDTARKTNDISLVTGNAGIGKTCATQLYLFDNPTSILITASAWVRNARDIMPAIWFAIDTKRYQSTVKKTDYLVERLKDSNRLLIVDNAHRLKVGGLEYLFDLHDATGMPIAFVGNPDILTYLRRNDQMFSRIGLHKHLVDYGTEKKQVADTLIAQIAPQFHDCADLAEKVITQKGHARALKKQLSLAEEVASKDEFQKDYPTDTNRAAFTHAHKRLIRDYAL